MKATKLVLALALASACGGEAPTAADTDAITDVPHTDVERQAIGNCWLYAQASWVESMHLARTGSSADLSQSYWTYWHWYGQILRGWSDEISTGGNQSTSNRILLERGLMFEGDFVPEDVTGEMSERQSDALDFINAELAGGRLADFDARTDGALVRDVLDEAWGLDADVVAQLDAAFGQDGAFTLRWSDSTEGTDIIHPSAFPVRYSVGFEEQAVDASASDAVREWRTVGYPYGISSRRAFLGRVQRALHDRQPVVITWNVDFNALENRDNEFAGSFNLTTLEQNGSPGRQGGHMTVLEDYEAVTDEFGLLEAGVTLDPENEEDARKLAALLLPSTEIVFLRIKNSWGSLRPDRRFAEGFPGYHDLYMDYMNGPIAWCPNATDPAESCTGSSVPLRSVMLPPGY